MLVILPSLFLVIASATPVEKISHASNVVKDVTSSSAPAYWTAECGDRTYVGSYTLTMDWAECRDYCQYFPHSGELGHSFTFADILDTDTMECLRYNMNQQYTPGNGYAGHYWAGGYRGGDGQYMWDSGEPFDFHDFIGNPGDEPYVHLTPGNNYQWNTKSDTNDRNNGCLCKSREPSSEAKIKENECPGGWQDLGSQCLHFVLTNMNWNEARTRCQEYGADSVSLYNDEEYLQIKHFLREQCVGESPTCQAFWTTGNELKFIGDWIWGDGPEFISYRYWAPGYPIPNSDNNHCAWIDGQSNDVMLANPGGCEFNYNIFGLCQIRK